jgi:hypothetical protein
MFVAIWIIEKKSPIKAFIRKNEIEDECVDTFEKACENMNKPVNEEDDEILIESKIKENILESESDADA